MHDKDATPIEAIDFETRQESAQENKKSKHALNHKPILWFAFIALLLCAAIVFLFLPKYVENSSKPNTVEKIEEPPFEEFPKEIIPKESFVEAAPKLSPEELNELKQEAEALLLQLIEKQKLLEKKAVKKWAEDEFNIALTLGTSGDEQFRKNNYAAAITSYQNSLMVLNDLEKKIVPTLALHLEKGELALTQAEKNTAIVHFELAKAIEAENIQAINGLKRAETINELYALLEQGGKLEATNRFVDAKNAYQEATLLDPLSTEAKTALNRVASRLAENEFTGLINKGYATLKLRQYGNARTAFLAAQKISPNSSKPQQGIAEIDQAIHDEKLTALNAEAQQFEETQDWSNATYTYQQMLVISSNSSIAQDGLARSQKREAILVSLNEHINNKLRLGSEKVSSEAEQLLQQVASVNNPGSKITQKAATLKEFILLAKQPVSITLQSDNQTDIAIFKVGKLGKFEQRKVDLKIGKYTIVGSRSGFRDVRKVITVSSDMNIKSFKIRCEEPI